MKGITPAAVAAFAKGDLDNFVAASTPGGIERQEAQGQRDLCASQQLPIKMQGCSFADFKAHGFEFGKPVDDLFIEVRFPSGWSLRPTDHSMWSDLVDGAGLTQFKVFYKAAFYDRRAFIRPAAKV